MLLTINANLGNDTHPGWKQLARDIQYVCDLLRLCLTTEKEQPFRELYFNFEIEKEKYCDWEAREKVKSSGYYNFFPDQFALYQKNRTTIAIAIYVEVAQYDNAVGVEKFQVILDWAERAGSSLYEKTGNSSKPFAVAAQRIRTLGFSPSLILGPLRNSPDRKLKGAMEVEMTPETLSYNFLFFDKKENLLKRIPCRSIKWPSRQHGFLTETGDWAWLSNDKFVFTSWGGYPCWTLSLLDEKVDDEALVSKKIGPGIGRQSFPKVVLWDGFWKYKGI